MTVADVVKFVLANRRNKVCRNWSPYDITRHVARALELHTLAYVEANGQLTGVVWGAPDYCNKILHIETILTTTKDGFVTLMRYFLTVYDGWTLTAERRGKFVQYNTERLRRTYGR